MSHTKPRDWKPLGLLETAVLHLLWRDGALTAEAVRERLAPQRVLKDATVRTVLRRLENKGYAQHKVVGRTYVYRSSQPPHTLALQAVREIVDRYCGGDVDQLLEAMIEAGLLNRRDLKRAAKRH